MDEQVNLFQEIGSENNTSDVINTDHMKDPGWAHCTAITANKRKVKCHYCGKDISGGINRFKYHLARIKGESAICLKVPADVCLTMKNALLNNAATIQSRKRIKRSLGDFGRTEEDNDNEEIHILSAERNEVLGKKTTQITMPNMLDKKSRLRVCEIIARWFYHAAIPFNATDSAFFPMVCEALGSYGRGFKPPTPYELSTPLLKGEVEILNTYMKESKASWADTGCTIMSDGWKDQKGRTLNNFLVSCPHGTMFIRTVNASKMIKNAINLSNLLDHIVQEIGEENVVQIVTDNEASYVAAGRFLMDKRPHLFWTPCAAHCINLILEKIGKLKRVEEIVEKAKRIAKFIYNHAWVLNLMRQFTNDREIIRPAQTRFATNFILIESLLDQRSGLRKLFICEEWSGSRYAKLDEGLLIEDITLDGKFWRKLDSTHKLIQPLITVLRLADGDDKPTMGYIYEAIDKAKKDIIIASGNDESTYKDIIEIIDDRVKSKLKGALHLAGYFLNPSIHYRHDALKDIEIRRGLQQAIEVLEMDEDKQIYAIDQIKSFVDASGMFGSSLAIASRSKISPVSWWESYGMDTPELQRIAVRILSQTCSSSGCERNWSTFDQIYTKKRNKLKQERLDKLVFIHYNLRLREHQLKRHGASYDPININNVLLSDIDEEWINDEDDEEEDDDDDDDVDYTNSQDPVYNYGFGFSQMQYYSTETLGEFSSLLQSQHQVQPHPSMQE